jgi:hypothetical protein
MNLAFFERTSRSHNRHLHLLLGLLQALSDVLPVDNLPDVLDVVGSHVLVHKVVRVLPHVDAQQRHQSGGGLQGVLVGGGGDDKLLVRLVVSQPAPARALDTNRGVGHKSLEVILRAVLVLDQGAEVALGEVSAALVRRGKVLPKDAVVEMATTVELDRLLQRNNRRDIALLLGFFKLRARHIKVGNICSVVLLVMELHDLSGDLNDSRKNICEARIGNLEYDRECAIK